MIVYCNECDAPIDFEYSWKNYSEDTVYCLSCGKFVKYNRREAEQLADFFDATTRGG